MGGMPRRASAEPRGGPRFLCGKERVTMLTSTHVLDPDCLAPSDQLGDWGRMGSLSQLTAAHLMEKASSLLVE